MQKRDLLLRKRVVYFKMLDNAVREHDEAEQRIKKLEGDIDEVEKQIREATGPITDADLVYAATTRCPCGAGVAYVDELNIHGYWDCSRILLGTADESVQHCPQMPFAFYNIKSEKQPSANGATTRPSTDPLSVTGLLCEHGRESLLCPHCLGVT